ncbi:MAG: AI-2E family transporter [Burkholderiaceae bacterium]
MDAQADGHTIYRNVFAGMVVLLTLYLTRQFIPPVLWAGVLAMASWPLYMRILRLTGGRAVCAASLTTAIVAAVFIGPVVVFGAQAVAEAPLLAHRVAAANQEGIAMPAVFKRVPFAGPFLEQWWTSTLAQPHGLGRLFAEPAAGRHVSAGILLRLFGGRVLHALIDFCFCVLCLFFFYLDGASLQRQIDAIGAQFLGAQHWARYARNIPLAINSTVNGLVLVGLAEGVLLGIAYLFAGVPSALLWGAATAALAIIPFGAPLAYLSATLLLFASGNASGAALVAGWGTVVLLIADHFVRPRIIGGATKMPFLLVLFGILGGVASFGLIGLFVGPTLMALFVTLWRAPIENVGQGVSPLPPKSGYAAPRARPSRPARA